MNIYSLLSCRKVWVEQLSDAIKACTTAHAETVLPVGKRGTSVAVFLRAN